MCEERGQESANALKIMIQAMQDDIDALKMERGCFEGVEGRLKESNRQDKLQDLEQKLEVKRLGTAFAEAEQQGVLKEEISRGLEAKLKVLEREVTA